ncbi:hypothetical protein WA538_003903, partial [Blastocystis sp. DL]
MESEPISEAQIRKYEDLIENKIKPSLTREMDALKELTSLVEQYEVLRTNIQMMKKEEEKELKSLVNIGSEVYMQAHCPEKKYIYVNVGLGFHVQFTLDEALAFIEKKTKKLQADVVLKNADVEKVKEHYFSANHSLEQLKGLM